VQNTARQLEGVDVHKLFEDKLSGSTRARPGLNAMLEHLRAGDGNLSADKDVPKSITIIYWSDGDSGRLDGIPFRLSDVDRRYLERPVA